MRQRSSAQPTQQRGGENTGTGWRSSRGSTLAAVALVVLALAVVAGVGVAGAAAGTAGAATTADATSVAAAQDDATLDADITYIHDPSATSATVDPTRETIGFHGFNSSDADTEGLSHLEFEWSIDESASGTLTTTGSYPTDFFVEYELADADAGETFDVHLTITDENGTTATDSFTVTVTENDSATENLAPSASLVWTEDPSVEEPVVAPGETVRISAADSTDPDHATDELDYDWEIADGASGNVTLEDDGAVLAYDVSPGDEGQTISFAVTVTDPEGANDTMAIAVDVASTAEPESPTAVADLHDAPGTDQISIESDRAAINFTGFQSTNPNGALSDLDFEWSVEGNASGEFVAFDAYDDEWFTTYELGPDDAGATFDVVLTVTDSTGATSSDSVTVTVAEAEAPTANATWKRDAALDEPVVDQTVDQFVLSGEHSLDPNYDRENLTFEWSVAGDHAGELDDSEPPFATYQPAPADYGRTLEFTLTVTNDDGYSATDTISVELAAEPPTAVLEFLDAPGNETVTVDGNDTTVTVTALNSSDNYTERQALEFAWGTEGNVTGEFNRSDAYVGDWFSTYEIESAEPDSTFQIVLTVTNEAGLTDTAMVTVDVAADWHGSDGDDGTDGEDGTDGSDDGDDSSDGPGFSPGPSTGSGTDGGSSDGDEPASAPFAFSVDSTADSIVLRGENARAGSSASVDLAVVLGGVQLNSFEGEAAGDADAFEVTIATSDRSGPDVDGDVVQVFDVSEGENLASSALELAVASSAFDASNATVYEYSDGEWAETDAAAADGTMSADVAAAQALAVVSPSSDDGAPADDPDDAAGGDGGFGTVAIALLLGVLLVVGGVEYYRRQ